jgi:BirA family biotin operon repressor/biotin-[acetyl-CoA-carboxylase] ligase
LTTAETPPLYRHARLGSTNDEARRLADAGAPHGTAVQASEQTAGRGRRGRAWFSPVGNLHLSMLLDAGAEPARASELAFVAAVSLREALATLAPEATFACKWPNDILCGGAKVAGMLLENHKPMVILGIGVNVIAAPPESEVQYKATSLAAHACAANADDVAIVVRENILAWHSRWRSDGFAPVREEWLDHAAGVGETVTVRLADARVLEGRFGGLDAGGALLLDTPDGARRPILAGDVFFAA